MSTQVGSIGDVKYSLLDETQFQSQYGVNWILADGRSISGSALSLLTGISTLPDFRGCFVRGVSTESNNTDQNDYELITYTVDTSTNIFTLDFAPTLGVTALTTGQHVSNTGQFFFSVPPAPLTFSFYYVIKINSTQFKLATTLENAKNGIEIDITTTGLFPAIGLFRTVGTQQGHVLGKHGHTGNTSLESSSHTHTIPVADSGTFINEGSDVSFANQVIAGTTITGLENSNHTHSLTITSIAGPPSNPRGESRPLNIAVYIYIRIN